MIRISEIRVAVDATDADIAREITHRLRIPGRDLISWRVWRQSVDARRTGRVCLSFTVDITVRDESAILGAAADPSVVLAPENQYVPVQSGSLHLSNRPVVIGTGPAGLFAGLLLARRGYRPLIVDRGPDVDARVRAVDRFFKTGTLDLEANVQFGEGGAGTFSDGKLGTQIRDPRCRLVIDEMVAAGAPPEVATSCRPHVGTDRLRGVVRQLRETIVAHGGEVRFSCRLDDLDVANGQIRAVRFAGGERLATDVVILAPGHSARDTFAMLLSRGVAMEQKPFSMGVRIEHHQAMVDRAQYRELARHPRLGPATYKLVWHGPDDRSTYTFCMCPGGIVVAAASEAGGVVTNGMSAYARDGQNANSGLVVGIHPGDYGSDHPLAGVAFQQKWERAAFEQGGGGYAAPAQRVEDYLAGRPSERLGSVAASYTRNVLAGDVSLCLPPAVARAIKEALPALDRQLRGFAHPDAVMTGVETRTSSPVRILRNDVLESNVRGLYPTGEGAGYAGGIVSAAVDGLRVAETVVQRYAPFTGGGMR